MQAFKLIPILLLLAFVSCQPNRSFPPVQPLSSSPNSQFVLTQHDTLLPGKNAIYSVSMLFAWSLVQENLSEIKVNKNDYQLWLLNADTNYKNSLNKDELDLAVDIKNDGLIATAKFKKSLPFDVKLERFSEPLLFKNKKVNSFGLYGGNEEMANSAEILYYHNDSDFVIKLLPKDKDHEIIIYNFPTDTCRTFAGHLAKLNRAIAIGTSEKNNNPDFWKYNFKGGDILQIPVLEFNLETHFSSLEKHCFKASNRTVTITEAQQRTAFILDELGAEIESEAKIALDMAVLSPVEEHPKLMVLNKPFLVILKRRNNPNPYFMARLENDELMKIK